MNPTNDKHGFIQNPNTDFPKLNKGHLTSTYKTLQLQKFVIKRGTIL